MELRHVGHARRIGRGDWWGTVGLDRRWGIDIVRAFLGFPFYIPIVLMYSLSELTNDGKAYATLWQDCSVHLSA